MSSNYQVGGLIYGANICDGVSIDLAGLHFYRQWLPRSRGARILELCCGTGRLTLPIAKDGYNIGDVDYTFSILNRAKIEASEVGLKTRFIKTNAKTLNLQGECDLVFTPFNSIRHLYKNEDLLRVFNVAKNRLKEGSLFLLDCFNSNIRYIVEDEEEPKEMATYATGDGGKVLVKQTV